MPEVRRQSEEDVTIGLQGLQQTRTRAVRDALRNIRQNLAVARLLAPPVWCAEEDDTNGDIADGPISRLQSCLE
jgi:hypothetical protein